MLDLPSGQALGGALQELAMYGKSCKVYTAEISALKQLQSQLIQLIGHMHADNDQACFDTFV